MESSVVLQTFNSSTAEAEAGESLKFKTSLAYRGTRIKQRNPVSKLDIKFKNLGQVR